MSYRNINLIAWAAAIASLALIPFQDSKVIDIIAEILFAAAIAGWAYVHGANSVFDRIKSTESTKEMSN